MTTETYVPVMDKKPVTRSARLSADVFEGIERLKDRLAERNVQRLATWNSALEYALGYLKMVGFLDDPDKLINANHEAAKQLAAEESRKKK